MLELEPWSRIANSIHKYLCPECSAEASHMIHNDEVNQSSGIALDGVAFINLPRSLLVYPA